MNKFINFFQNNIVYIKGIIVYKVFNLFREIFIILTRKDYIILNSYSNYAWGKFHHYNFGDDLNKYLFGDCIGKKVILYEESLISRLFKRTNYLFIGSYIGAVNAQNTIVWGAGLISIESAKKDISLHKVLAVRGPLTRELLIKKGFNCPEIYGDPALLLPYFYKPKSINKKYKLGIIPHIHDENNPIILSLAVGNPDVLLISLSKYNNWHDVIDQICECEFVASTSLHGIIISDAYKTPNCWIEVSDRVEGKGFKFRDYFLSVGRTQKEPIVINEQTSLTNILALKDTWEAPKIDLSKLISVCPLDIQELKKSN